MTAVLKFARRRHVPLITANLLLLLVITLVSPLEQTLGWRVRAVYFHGAWVWTGLAAYGLAALAGLAAFVWAKRRAFWADVSLALGRAGLFFWLTYLPMSLWVQQINWGGIYWDEPRWKAALAFGVASILIQIALVLFDFPLITSSANLVFGGALFGTLANIQNVMHPESPIFSSGSTLIKVFFLALLILSLLFLGQLGLAFYRPRQTQSRK